VSCETRTHHDLLQRVQAERPPDADLRPEVRLVVFGSAKRMEMDGCYQRWVVNASIGRASDDSDQALWASPNSG